MGWPVVLVVDVGGQAQSAAATALGFRDYMPDLPFAGVILNRIASPRHERLTRLGMERAEIPRSGCALPRRGDLALPERHLGLAGRGASRSTPPSRITRPFCARMWTSTRSAPPQKAMPCPLPQRPADPARPAHRAGAGRGLFLHLPASAGGMAGGRGRDPALLATELDDPVPEGDLVWLPGEAIRARRASRRRGAVPRQRCAGTPKAGRCMCECGGYMALGAALIDKDGQRHAMAAIHLSVLPDG